MSTEEFKGLKLKSKRKSNRVNDKYRRVGLFILIMISIINAYMWLRIARL